MGAGGGDAFGDLEEGGGGVFVGGDGGAEGDVAEVLEGVGEGEVVGVVGCPEAVALGEFFGGEGGETEEIVGAVFDHVDAEVVAGVDAEVGANFVARVEAFEFDESVEGGVLHAFDFGDVEEAADHVVVEDFAVGGEHLAEFEGEDCGVAFAGGGINGGFFGVGFSVEAAGLEEDGCAAVFCDGFHLAAVEGGDVVARVVLDVGAGDERRGRTEGFAGPAEDV